MSTSVATNGAVNRSATGISSPFASAVGSMISATNPLSIRAYVCTFPLLCVFVDDDAAVTTPAAGDRCLARSEHRATAASALRRRWQTSCVDGPGATTTAEH